MKTIDSFVGKKIVVLPQSHLVRDAAGAMRDHQIGCVVVCGDEGEVVGILTDRDLACRLVADLPESATLALPISKVMTPDPVTVQAGCDLNDVVQLMVKFGVRRIPVIEKYEPEAERCIGMVTLDDLIAADAVEVKQAARIIKRQIGLRSVGITSQKSARAQLRSEAHSKQTLERFFWFFGERLDMSPDLVPQVAHFLLGSLLMRLTYESAGHLIAQLPSLLHEQLLRLPPGPDRTVTVDKLSQELVSRFGFTEEYAREIVRNFGSALAEYVNPGQIRHLQAELPEDFRAIFAMEDGFRSQEEFEVIPKEKINMSLKLRSSAFVDGAPLPRRHTGDGQEKSPALDWSGVPEGTHEFALICEDPDASARHPFVHWVAYGISNSITSLPEGLPKLPELELPVRLRQGKNTSGQFGYQGPMPPVGSGAHRYVFRLFAVDREIPLRPGATKEQLLVEIRGHVLAEAVLTGRYAREAGRKAA